MPELQCNSNKGYIFILKTKHAIFVKKKPKNFLLLTLSSQCRLVVNFLRLEITLIKIGFCSKIRPLKKKSATCAHNSKRLSLSLETSTLTTVKT